MPTGLSGSGTQADPWLISSQGEFYAVIRDTAGAGYYRIVDDIYPVYAESLIIKLLERTASHGVKTIDGNGCRVLVRFEALGTTGDKCLFRNLKFSNIALFIAGTPDSGKAFYVFSGGEVLNSILYHSPISGQGAGYYCDSVTMTYVGIMAGAWGLNSMTSASALQGGTGTFTGNHIWATSFVGGGFTRQDSSLGLMSYVPFYTWLMRIDSNSLFLLPPPQVETVSLTLQTRVNGVPTSRQVKVLSRGEVKLLGVTGSDGLGQFSISLQRRAPFQVLADEEVGHLDLFRGRRVLSGGWYLPPVRNGFIYQASAGGAAGSLSGVVFNDQPVTIAGITYTPRPVYAGSASLPLSVMQSGLAFNVALDTVSGGGPIIEGDPAYLDGVVEEIHPITGSLRPLSNAEVMAFERRGESYTALGMALSNSIGEFRVNTEIYGGGDVFAFAADFPGAAWQPGASLGIGDRVRPTVNNGYVYEVITAGNSGSTEPAWWADAGDGTEGAIGSATAQARPYYQPVGHGPLKMTLVE